MKVGIAGDFINSLNITPKRELSDLLYAEKENEANVF